MKTSANSSTKSLGGIAGLFDDAECKQLFRKYLIFLGWIEVLIFVTCWLSQLGNDGYDRYGPIETPFPWKVYFLVSFLAPVAITFLLGIVVVGFNRYLMDSEPQTKEALADGVKPGHTHKLYTVLGWFQHVPFLGLLLLLGVGVAIFYRIDTILGFFSSVGEKSVKVLLMSGAVLIGIASVLALILVFLNYQLRKRAMEYQYKTEVAERFGLIILDDNTVLNSEGKLLVQGAKWKQSLPLLTAETPEETVDESSPGTIHGTPDLETS